MEEKIKCGAKFPDPNGHKFHVCSKVKDHKGAHQCGVLVVRDYMWGKETRCDRQWVRGKDSYGGKRTAAMAAKNDMIKEFAELA